jgi:hypothetical protein
LEGAEPDLELNGFVAKKDTKRKEVLVCVSVLNLLSKKQKDENLPLTLK